MPKLKVCSIAAILGVAALSDSYAQIVVIPTDLEPGDEYRLVFITKDKIFTAESSNIADYDGDVTNQASMSAVLAQIDTNWRVIGSTSSVDAKIHTDTDDSPLGPTGVPIYRLDGLRIADDYDDLWDGNIQHPLYIAQNGATLNTCCGTWTGTNSNGNAATGYELGAGPSVVDGAPNGTASNWIQTSPYPADQLQYLYAISDVLVVPGADINVGVEIKPSGKSDCQGVIPVAVLGSATFDVSQIDTETLSFQGLDVRMRGNGSVSCGMKDVNLDGYSDLLCQYTNGETDGVITGRLLDGTNIEGSDTFCVAH